MVTGFDVGKYYRYKYTECKSSNWSSTMEKMLDQKPRRCLKIGNYNYKAVFQGISPELWNWDVENFELVDVKDIPEPEIKLLKYGEIYSLQNKMECFAINKRKKYLLLNKAEASFVAGCLQECRYHGHLPEYDDSDTLSNEDGV